MMAPPPAARHCRSRKVRRDSSTSIESTPLLSSPVNVGYLAVIDRFYKTRLDQPAFEKVPAPFGNRQVHHVGHDVDARHQPAVKAVALRHRVVVHLVLGMF